MRLCLWINAVSYLLLASCAAGPVQTRGVTDQQFYSSEANPNWRHEFLPEVLANSLNSLSSATTGIEFNVLETAYSEIDGRLTECVTSATRFAFSEEVLSSEKVTSGKATCKSSAEAQFIRALSEYQRPDLLLSRALPTRFVPVASEAFVEKHGTQTFKGRFVPNPYFPGFERIGKDTPNQADLSLEESIYGDLIWEATLDASTGNLLSWKETLDPSVGKVSATIGLATISHYSEATYYRELDGCCTVMDRGRVELGMTVFGRQSLVAADIVISEYNIIEGVPSDLITWNEVRRIEPIIAQSARSDSKQTSINQLTRLVSKLEADLSTWSVSWSRATESLKGDSFRLSDWSRFERKMRRLLELAEHLFSVTSDFQSEFAELARDGKNLYTFSIFAKDLMEHAAELQADAVQQYRSDRPPSMISMEAPTASTLSVSAIYAAMQSAKPQIALDIAIAAQRDRLAMELFLQENIVPTPIISDPALGIAPLRDLTEAYLANVMTVDTLSEIERSKALESLLFTKAWTSATPGKRQQLRTAPSVIRALNARRRLFSPNGDSVSFVDRDLVENYLKLSELALADVSIQLGVNDALSALETSESDAIVIISEEAGIGTVLVIRAGKSGNIETSALSASVGQNDSTSRYLLTGDRSRWNTMGQIPVNAIDVDKAISNGRGWLAALNFDGRAEGTSAQKVQRLKNEIDRISTYLGEAYIEPTVQLLSQIDIKPGSKITLILDGDLASLPFSAASFSSDPVFLLDKWTVAHLPNTAKFSIYSGNRGRNNIVTGIFSGEGLQTPPLVRSALEHFSGTKSDTLEDSMSDNGATLPANSILHISTHGQFDWTNLSQSQFQTASGSYATLKDLQEIVGPGSLVFLAACELGAIELAEDPALLRGFQTSLLEAGAKGVVAAQWPVDEWPTALLTIKFYENYIQKGLSGPQSLRESQLWLRDATNLDILKFLNDLMVNDDGWRTDSYAITKLGLIQGSDFDERPFSHPYYWAGFTYYGW